MLYALYAFDKYGSKEGADNHLVLEGTARDIESIGDEYFEHYVYSPLTVDTYKTLDELNDMFSHDPDGFLQKYCKQ